MNLHENKIQEIHIRRKACVYVRQSTLTQVQEHQESTKRQYELYERARQLGWLDSQIEIIDEDLGHSASDASQQRTVISPAQRLVAWETRMGPAQFRPSTRNAGKPSLCRCLYIWAQQAAHTGPFGEPD